MTHKRDLVVALSRMSFLSCGQKIVLLNNLDNLSKVELLSIEELKKLSGKNLDKTHYGLENIKKRILGEKISQMICEKTLCIDYEVLEKKEKIMFNFLMI